MCVFLYVHILMILYYVYPFFSNRHFYLKNVEDDNKKSQLNSEAWGVEALDVCWFFFRSSLFFSGHKFSRQTIIGLICIGWMDGSID